LKPFVAPERPKSLGIWLLVVSLLLTCFPFAPALAAAPGALVVAPEAVVSAASCLDDCCEVSAVAIADDCCSPEGDEDEDPCCPEGCKQCHRPCCSGPLALIAPRESSFPSSAGRAQPEPQDEVLRSARSLGIFHPPRA
tara:strand:+ start:141 stop:557 length:417 start_codon:yes stop_codon:yes gene_type:complete